MKNALPMGFQFVHDPDLPVILIYQYYFVPFHLKG